jgi:hypothetical protein
VHASVSADARARVGICGRSCTRRYLRTLVHASAPAGADMVSEIHTLGGWWSSFPGEMLHASQLEGNSKGALMTAKRSDLVLSALAGLGLALTVFVVSAVGKSHFGPLDGLCNGSLEIEPHQGAGAIANCTLDTAIYSVSVYAYWAAIAVGVLSVVVLVLGFAAAPQKLATSANATSSSTSASTSAATAWGAETLPARPGRPPVAPTQTG